MNRLEQFSSNSGAIVSMDHLLKNLKGLRFHLDESPDLYFCISFMD